MATMQEGFLLFSLKHLSNTEKKYVLETESERFLHEARSSAMDAALAHARANTERRAREEADRRTERIQAETAYVLAVERARAEVEMSTRMEASRIALEHERAMALINADVQKKRLAQALRFGIIVPTLLFFTTLGIYFGKVKPDAEARMLSQQADIIRWNEEVRLLRAQVAARDAHIRDAERVLAGIHARAKRTETEDGRENR
jgi:colicin import membrane protein